MNVRFFVSRVSPALLLVPLLSGCVFFVHDSKSKMRPVVAQLDDFAGTYSNNAHYYTAPNAFGLMGHTTLSGLWSGYRLGENVIIDISRSGEILIVGYKDDTQVPIVRFTSKQYKFEESTIRFNNEFHYVGYDSPEIGFFTSSMRWMLDEKQRLVVVSSSTGGGLFTFIPVVVTGRTVSIFERVNEHSDLDEPPPSIAK